ncbi:hypothetical protein AKJ09_11238 [Labilithrix luteola]|uniref:Uncharacterized protein n=1 Tax=Labilithrix luteola TaxID=1391654 RepID=A0A0K1QGL3_9BACT|nr:hypothetical protein AKJ09_11238 [Labilithrix luteola]
MKAAQDLLAAASIASGIENILARGLRNARARGVQTAATRRHEEVDLRGPPLQEPR